MSMLEDFRSLILADAGVSGSIGSRVYAGRRPQGSDLPAITFHSVSGAPIYADDGEAGLHNSRIQCDCWGMDFAAARDLADLLIEALSAVRDVTQGGTTFIYILVDNEQNLEEGGSNTSQYLFRTSVDFEVWTNF